MISMYMFLRRIEDLHSHKYADFAVLVVFNAIMIMFFCFLYGSYMILHQPFLTSLSYVWS